MVARALSLPCESPFRFSAPRSVPAKTSARVLLPMSRVSEGSMKQSCVPLPTNVCSLDEREDLSGRVINFLRNKYPVKTEENVGADVGIRVTTVQKWLERHSAPSSIALVKMIAAYGPEFLAAVMGDYAPRWLIEKEHEARRAEIEARMAALQQELKSL